VKDVVFTTYSFGELYCYQQERLKESILKVYPKANMMFWSDADGASHPQPGRPPGAKPFSESMYGFKVHCMLECLKQGYKKIVFLDAAMILEGPIDHVLELASKKGFLAAYDRTELKNVISDSCRKYVEYDWELDNIDDLTLVGGSLYVLDFDNKKGRKVFERWQELEDLGFFGKEEDDARGLLKGHRKDETCLSLALAKEEMSPCGFDEIGYHNMGHGDKPEKGFTFYKLHFKGIGQVHEHSLNQSIIPLHGNILDLGCRDFIFTDFFKNQEYNVVSVDIGVFEGDYVRAAISHKDGKCFHKEERDPDASHIEHSGEIKDIVPMMTLDTLSKKVGVGHWDLIKMDVEGSEFEILKQGKHPMASQICVEFHAHCTPQTKESLDELLDMLSEFYFIHGREWKEEHSAGFNYWDVLLIAKDSTPVRYE